MLKSRLTWHCHFIQKLESEPELEFKEFHPYFQKIKLPLSRETTPGETQIATTSLNSLMLLL